VIPQPLDVNTIKDSWDYWAIVSNFAAGFGALAAVGATIWIFVRQLKDMRWAQARRVVFQYLDFPYVVGMSDNDEGPIYQFESSLTNMSDLPITNVRVYFSQLTTMDGVHLQISRPMAVRPEGRGVFDSIGRTFTLQMQPNDPMDSSESFLLPVDQRLWRSICVAFFTDKTNSGNWVIDENLKLRRVSEPVPNKYLPDNIADRIIRQREASLWSQAKLSKLHVVPHPDERQVDMPRSIVGPLVLLRRRTSRQPASPAKV
jgi:hypothetical protein